MITANDLTRVSTDRLPKKELISLFSHFMLNTDMSVMKIQDNKVLGTVDFICFGVRGNAVIHTMLKNVSGAGWSWKPEIKRIQVKSIPWDSIPPINEKEVFLLGGFSKVDGIPVFVCWNIFSYTSHRTNRSCYVSVDHLLQGKEKGFLRTIDSDNRIYLSTQSNFRSLLEVFIKDCSVE